MHTANTRSGLLDVRYIKESIIARGLVYCSDGLSGKYTVLAETLAEGNECALHLGPERPRVYSKLSPKEKEWYNADIRATNIPLQGLPKDIYTLINHYTDAKDIWDNVKMLLEGLELTKKTVNHNCMMTLNTSVIAKEKLFMTTMNQAMVQDGRVVVQNVQGRQNRGQWNNARGVGAAGYGGAQNRVRNANPGQARQIKCYNCNDLALNADNVFQADDCDAFNSEVYEAPTAQTMFMVNLSFADPIYDEASPSYDSDILSEVPDHENYQDVVFEYHEVYEMHDNKENKYFEEFLDMKALKEKVEENLYKQDQSLQTVYMLCKPKSYYDEQNKVSIGYKNPLYLTRAQQVQPALYNGHGIIKTNHVLVIVHNSEETLEIAKITSKKMNDKMKNPKYIWSKDLLKMKEEALEEHTTALRPIKALTVYLSNTHATLVPRVLPTKIQVKINIFALIQLFLDFEKTCKRRITPTGLTEGERGFEQTKECYLTKVISFFKTLKDHFEGIQKALTKEIKEMKEIFKELEAEVDQHVVNRKHPGIEQKNLLIANDNLIVDCLSKDVFYSAIDYVLTVSRFFDMHEAFNAAQKRIAKLESKNSNLQNKIQNDDHDAENEKVKRHYKELNNRKVHLDYLKHLKESVATLREIVKEARVEKSFDSSLASACR
nr:hypothetical protein [Tanacetum cinerariifolium]